MYAILHPSTWVLVKTTPNPALAAAFVLSGFHVTLVQRGALA